MSYKLSKITINLNNAEGLRKTIESVVSQTFTDYVFIVIDGANSDNSEVDNTFYKNQRLFFEKWKSVLPLWSGIQEIPKYSINQVNKLYSYWNKCEEDKNNIYNLRSYKLGKFIFHPFSFLRRNFFNYD